MSEIVIKVEVAGLENLVNALLSLSGKPTQVEATASQNLIPDAQVNLAPAGQGYQAPPVQQMYQAPPVQQMQVTQAQQMQAPPVQQMYQAPPVQQMPIPTTAMVQEFTRDQLAVASAGLVNQGKQQRLIEILGSYGVTSLVELDNSRYGEFATALRMEGAVI